MANSWFIINLLSIIAWQWDPPSTSPSYVKLSKEVTKVVTDAFKTSTADDVLW